MSLVPDAASAAHGLETRDRLGRPLRELRLSVTDRCNFRCGYCMPREVFDDRYEFTPRAQLLSFEELTRVARVAANGLGVAKLRITGGEPLLRRDLPTLVRMLSEVAGVRDLALTTNGHLLAEQARSLADAGLQRVTVSLDALDPETFRTLSGGEGSPERVLAGIEAAERAGLTPIKINCVVIRGKNEHAIEPLARRFRGTSAIVRFIEYMDVGTLNRWDVTQVVSALEIRNRLNALAPIEAIDRHHPSEVAERFRYTDGSGEVGVIASVSAPFCGDCSRARISADGRFLTCLFSSSGISLRDTLRAGATDAELLGQMAAAWRARDDRYSERRAELRRDPRRRLEMYQIGG